MSRRAVGDIRNTALRRTVLLIVIVPVIVVGACVYGLKAAWEVVLEGLGSFGPVWRGER